MADCIPGTCGCPAPKCPCTCGKTFGPVDLRRVWRVGTSTGYEPFEFYDLNGAIIGFDIDLIKIIGERLRFVVDVHDMDFNSLFPALGVRYIDVIAAAVSETLERSKFADFTKPYYESGMVLLSHDGDIDESQPISQLNGKIVAAQSGTTQEAILHAIKEGGGDPPFDDPDPYAPGMMIYTNVSLPTIVTLMGAKDNVEVQTETGTYEGPIHATIMIDKVADSYIVHRPQPPLVRTTEAFLNSVETCSFALPLGSSLVDVINDILDELLEPGGEIDRLIEKWFGGVSVEQTP